MKSFSSILVILIALCLLAQTAVTTYCPGILKSCSTALPGDAEETNGEDEPGEDDKAIGGPAAEFVLFLIPATPAISQVPLLFDSIREIIAPPPQG